MLRPVFEDEDVTLPGNRFVRFVGEAGCAALAHASLGARRHDLKGQREGSTRFVRRRRSRFSKA
jgi:hypothetical protein